MKMEKKNNRDLSKYLATRYKLVKAKQVKQSRYRPGVAQSVPGI